MNNSDESQSAFINRLRWQSRRGTLELDLILQKFWHNSELHSEQNLHALAEILSLDDEQLHQAIRNGKSDKDQFSPAANAVVQLLRKL